MDWKLFGSTFALIFVSELPDKTAFASLILATRNDPLAVLCGAAGAFVVQSAVAVAFGSLFTILPAKFVHWGAGAAFLAMGVSMWRRAGPEDRGIETLGRQSFLRAMSRAFGVIFVAEWGDLTQLATAALSATYPAPVTIFTSATLALCTVAAIAVSLGHSARQSIQPKTLQRIAAVALAGIGLTLLLHNR